MSKNWDFYHSKVDHKPAYIFFDLEISKEVDLSEYTYMAYVRLYLLAPNGDGLSTNEEYENLCDIEDSLENKLIENKSAYVGRNTSDGCRDFYFYIIDPSDWQQKVKLVMNDFPDYEYDAGEREDKNWDTYFNFIYPSTRDWETIKSRHVCDDLTKEGDLLTKEREIDHWIYFKNVLNREALRKR